MLRDTVRAGGGQPFQRDGICLGRKDKVSEIDVSPEGILANARQSFLGCSKRLKSGISEGPKSDARKSGRADDMPFHRNVKERNVAVGSKGREPRGQERRHGLQGRAALKTAAADARQGLRQRNRREGLTIVKGKDVILYKFYYIDAYLFIQIVCPANAP